MKFKISNLKFLPALTICSIFVLNGCSGSSESSEEKEEYGSEKKVESKTTTSVSEAEAEKTGSLILETAREEQKNEMYSSSNDSAYLYWINDNLFGNYSKCNVFAMNVLYKAGCKCPQENVTTYDLMDTARFADILPVIDTSESMLKGDLIIWNGHVIIFESYVSGNDDYVLAWWGGSRQDNNDKEIINDVAHGRYPLLEGYIVRRPVRGH